MFDIKSKKWKKHPVVVLLKMNNYCDNLCRDKKAL